VEEIGQKNIALIKPFFLREGEGLLVSVAHNQRETSALLSPIFQAESCLPTDRRGIGYGRHPDE
jgi:hypothetical protein